MLRTMAVKTRDGLVSGWWFEGTETVNFRYLDRVESEDGSPRWSDVESAHLASYPETNLWDFMIAQWGGDIDSAYYCVPIPRAVLAKV